MTVEKIILNCCVLEGSSDSEKPPFCQTTPDVKMLMDQMPGKYWKSLPGPPLRVLHGKVAGCNWNYWYPEFSIVFEKGSIIGDISLPLAYFSVAVLRHSEQQ